MTTRAMKPKRGNYVALGMEIGRLRTVINVGAFCAAMASLPSLAETASATAELAIAVNTCDGEQRAVSPKDIEYSPDWGGVSADGAYVVIEKVVHAGMYNAVTSTVATCAADAEGAYSYSVGDGDEPCIRLIQRVYSSGGVEIGSPLVRDVAFGVPSSPGTAAFADCRAESLRETVASGATANLTYDTAWATNAAAVTISAVKLTGQDGAETATNTMFAVAADATGVTRLSGLSAGWWRLLCRIDDSGGDSLIEYTAGDFKIKGGFIISIY